MQVQNSITRESVLQLIQARTSIDGQIDALGEILTSNRVGMTEPLTDAEGYPRNDIDVYQVRHARQKIICLQNDRKRVTAEIEDKLTALHEHARLNGMALEGMEVDLSPRETLTPIATVNLVVDGSPAFQAGLKVNDRILSVGHIDHLTFTSLNDIGTFVSQHQGTVVNVKVSRNGTVNRLALIPGPWNGKGLIGCNIIPYDSPER